jgi:hypothetical protein
MYGQHTAVGGAATLAYTGLNLAWYVTAAVGLVFAGLTLLQLARRPGKVRP